MSQQSQPADKARLNLVRLNNERSVFIPPPNATVKVDSQKAEQRGGPLPFSHNASEAYFRNFLLLNELN
jgi:hypothetical protein